MYMSAPLLCLRRCSTYDLPINQLFILLSIACPKLLRLVLILLICTIATSLLTMRLELLVPKIGQVGKL